MTADIDDRARRRLRPASGFGVVLLLAAGAAVAQAFGRFAYGVLLPAVRDDLGISNTVAGSLGTVNVGAYLAGSLAVAAASGRLRLLTIMRVGLVLATAGLVVSALAPGPGVLAGAMVLSGFGGAAVWIPTPAIAADAVGPERRSLAVALLGSGIGIGVVFSGQVAGAVRANLGDEAWRSAYIVMAGLAATLTLVTLAVVDHRQDQPTGGGRIGGFDALRRMRGWFPLTAAYTVFGLMYLLVLSFLATRLEDDNGWTSGDAALAFTVVGLATVFGAPVFVTLAGRIGPSRALALAFGLWSLLTVAVLPGWFAPTLVTSAGLGLVFSAIPSMITLYVVANTTAEDYGPSFAAATLAFGVTQTLSPQLGGAVADATGSFLPVFVLSSVLGLAGAGFALRLPGPAGPSADEGR